MKSHQISPTSFYCPEPTCEALSFRSVLYSGIKEILLNDFSFVHQRSPKRHSFQRSLFNLKELSQSIDTYKIVDYLATLTMPILAYRCHRLRIGNIITLCLCPSQSERRLPGFQFRYNQFHHHSDSVMFEVVISISSAPSAFCTHLDLGLELEYFNLGASWIAFSLNQNAIGQYTPDRQRRNHSRRQAADITVYYRICS